MTGEFKEANESEIRLEDDEASLGLCIELLYAGIAGSGDVLSRIQQKEMAAVTLVAEKYMPPFMTGGFTKFVSDGPIQGPALRSEEIFFVLPWS